MLNNSILSGQTRRFERTSARRNAAVRRAACGVEMLEQRVLLTSVPSGLLLEANGRSGKVVEFDTSGNLINSSFISGLRNATAIAVSGTDVFVASTNSGNGTGLVGEYTTSGTTVNASLITGLNFPQGIAISGSDLFVSNESGESIGEYTTSGTPINTDLISTSGELGQVVVAGSNLFVTDITNGKIGEYTTSGGVVNDSLITGLTSPFSLAVSGQDLFIGTSNGVSEYTTAGALVNASLITGFEPGAIVVSGSQLFTTQFTGAIGEYSTSGTSINPALASDGLGTGGLALIEAPQILSASQTTFTAGSVSSFTVSTSGGPVSALTEQGTLPAGLTFVDNGDSTATISGTPGASTVGPIEFTITADNGQTPAATQTFTLTIDKAPSITSANQTTFTTGTLGSFNISTSSFPVSSLSEEGQLPSGVSFIPSDDGTATITGTPAVGFDGTYVLTITASNGISPDATQTFTLTSDQTPAITSASNAVFTTGSDGSFTVTTTGFPVGTITETGALPTGVTLVQNGDSNGTLSGTPAAGTDGTYVINILDSNGVSPDASQTFTLTVDQAPEITSAASTQFSIGSTDSFTIHTTGFPNSAITETGTTLPTGVTFVDNGDGTATISGVPGAPAAGTYNLTITASNSVSPDATQQFTLNIGADQATAITSPSAATFTAGTSGLFRIRTTGFPFAAITESGALPAGLTLTDNHNGTAVITGTPESGTGGTYSIKITARNGVTTKATQTLTLTVDEAPAITTDPGTTFAVGAAGSFAIETSGFPNASITESGALPTGVTLKDNHDGTATLSGTPAAGSLSSYAVVLTAKNGISPRDTQTFTLTVDQPPAITSAAAGSLSVGTLGTVTIQTTGFPTAAITETGALPSGVTFTDNGHGKGKFIGTPAAGSEGNYPITLTAKNGAKPNARQSFTLTVLGEPPAITSDSQVTFTIGASDKFIIQTSGDPTASITESGALPAGIKFVDRGDGTARLSGIAAAGTAKSYPLTFTAKNSAKPNARQTFTLIVTTQPVAVVPAVEGFNPGAIILSGSGNDTILACGGSTLS